MRLPFKLWYNGKRGGTVCPPREASIPKNRASPAVRIAIGDIDRYIQGLEQQLIAQYALTPMPDQTAHYLAASLATAEKIRETLWRVAESIAQTGKLPEEVDVKHVRTHMGNTGAIPRVSR